MKTDTEMAACLEEAARLIEEHGWARGAFGGRKGHGWWAPMCIIGACRQACPDTTQDEFAHALGFRNDFAAFKWNDDTVKKGAVTVLRRLRDRAKRLRG